MGIIRGDAPTQRPDKIVKLPTADAGFSIWRDVRGSDLAEGRVQDAPPGIRLAPMLGVGMALIAPGRRSEVSAVSRRV
jgi:hypothetical protein